MDYEIIKALITAILIGFMIGLQRSLTYVLKNEPFFIGSRTFALISLGGYICGWLNSKIEYFALISSLIFAAFIIISYIFKVTKLHKLGITTQTAAFITYLLGLMIWYKLENYAIFIAVILIVILEIKPRMEKIEKRISNTDIEAVVLLLVMSFIILPVLPDKMVGPYNLFNPYKTWIMAIIISALSFIGYVAIKILGEKHGVLITGAAGGVISSTAVSITLSKIFPKKSSFLKIYTAGICISWTFMFIRVFIETLIIDIKLAKIISIPYLLTSIIGIGYVYYLYKNSSLTQISFKNEQLEKNPLQLSEAIKFAILFGIIYGAIFFVKNRYGDIGVYVVSIISGITDVDAITLSLSEMAKENKLNYLSALTGIILASFTNTLAKLSLVYWLGGKNLGLSVTKFTLLITFTLFGGIFISKIILLN